MVERLKLQLRKRGMEFEELQKANHAAPKKSFEVLLDEACAQIASIVAEGDLRVIKFSWKAYEHVLDTIWGNIPQIRDAIPKISVPISFIKVDPARAEEVMKKLLESKVFDFVTSSKYIVSSTDPLRRFYSGEEIVIRDTERFQKIRNLVKSLISKIDEREKQLQAHVDTTETVSSPKKKVAKRADQSTISADVRAKFANAKKWEHVRFEFAEDGHFVEIFISEETAGEYNFDALGFLNNHKDKHTPLKSWDLLVAMSFNPDAMRYEEKLQPTKSDLQKRLMKLFPHLNGVPIQCDRHKKEYRCVFGIKNKAFSRDAFLSRKVEKHAPKSFLKDL